MGNVNRFAGIWYLNQSIGQIWPEDGATVDERLRDDRSYDNLSDHFWDISLQPKNFDFMVVWNEKLGDPLGYILGQLWPKFTYFSR